MLAVTRLCSRAVPIMRIAKWGRIINVASSCVKDPSGNVTYDAMKAAIVSYSKDLSNEVAVDNILVTSVCPGTTLTEMWNGDNSVGKKIADLEGISLTELLKSIAESIPLKRLAKPDEIADVITFLASDKASYITGQAFYVDGGSIRSAF